MGFKERFQPSLQKVKNHIIQNKGKYGLATSSILGAVGGAVGSQLTGVDDDYRQDAVQNMNSDIDNVFSSEAKNIYNSTGMSDYVNAVQNKYNAGWFDRAFNIDDLDKKVHSLAKDDKWFGDPNFNKTPIQKDVIDRTIEPVTNFFTGTKETAHKIDSGLSRSLSILKDKAFGEYDPKNYLKPESDQKEDDIQGPARDNVVYIAGKKPVVFDKHDSDIAQGQIRKALLNDIKSNKTWSNNVLQDWLESKGGQEKIQDHLNDYNSADFRAARNYGALGGLAGTGLFKAAQSKSKKKSEG